MFSIDDVVDFNISCQSVRDTIETISSFQPYKNTIIVAHRSTNFGYDKEIEYIAKVKQPLFTTEDGIDIFEGDVFYFIPLNFNDVGCGKLVARVGSVAECAEKRFSTKEKAEEYINLHKPQYSLHHMVRISEHWADREHPNHINCQKIIDSWNIKT